MTLDAALRRRALVVFSVLWALHVQADYASYRAWLVSEWSLLNTVVSLFLLLRPSSVRRLGASAGCYMAAWFATLPRVPNHETIGAFVSLAILGALALRWRESAGAPERCYAAFAPAARVTLLVMYFWAAFHKLNRDFLFEAEVTCAAHLYAGFRNLLPALPPVPDAVDLAMAWASLGVEALIPLLLLFRRTRVAGIALGWSFHSMLSFNPMSGFYNYTSLLFPLFLLFAPAGFYVYLPRVADAVLDRLARLAPSVCTLVRRTRPAAVVFAISAAIGLALVPGVSNRAPAHAGLWLWAALCLPLTAWVFAALAGYLRDAGTPVAARMIGEVGAGSRPPAPLWAIPALLVVWGATPYLGLKTENSLSMFSNLRTEVNPNHLLVPEGWKLFSFQDDSVKVRWLERNGRRSPPREPLQLPFEEFRTWLTRHGVTRVAYERGGQTYEATPADDAALFETSPLRRKFLTFRPFTADGPMPCVH